MFNSAGYFWLFIVSKQRRTDARCMKESADIQDDLEPTLVRRQLLEERLKKKKKLTVRRHYLIVYSCCEAYWASKAPVKVVLYSRDGASLLRPQQVCDAASAWQSV